MVNLNRKKSRGGGMPAKPWWDRLDTSQQSREIIEKLKKNVLSTKWKDKKIAEHKEFWIILKKKIESHTSIQRLTLFISIPNHKKEITKIFDKAHEDMGGLIYEPDDVADMVIEDLGFSGFLGYVDPFKGVQRRSSRSTSKRSSRRTSRRTSRRSSKRKTSKRRKSKY